MVDSDFLVIGGGVVGICIARELKRRNPKAAVLLIDKEAEVGLHASGRNSGVLHAGFYYTADSLKARFTRKGNEAMTEYCRSKGIPVNNCGKLVVARSAAELAGLDELLRRARTNGVVLEDLPEAEARRIEPRVRTFERALFSPSTSSVDPKRVMQSLASDALQEGVIIETGTAYEGRKGKGVRTSRGIAEAGYVINCGGLYADRIARDFGFSRNHRILPFKGLYLYSNEPAGALRTNVYPVPDLRNPFLGVHFTVTADGRAKIGPTAIPALWREQYRWFENFNMSEFLEVACRGVRLAFSSEFDFAALARAEIPKYARRKLVELAGELLDGVRQDQFIHWGTPGIRAQLVDIRRRRLEMDFVIEGDQQSLHVLNAVSPGFTCAMPFAAHVCDEIDTRLGARA